MGAGSTWSQGVLGPVRHRAVHGAASDGLEDLQLWGPARCTHLDRMAAVLGGRPAGHCLPTGSNGPVYPPLLPTIWTLGTSKG